MAILDGKLDVTTQEGYDIACALRGPDVGSLAILKVVVTGRLRHLVGISDCTASVTSAPLLSDIGLARRQWEVFCEWTEGMEDSRVRSYIRDALNHWAWHLEAAYRAMRKTEHVAEELKLLHIIAYALLTEADVAKALEAYADYIKEQQ